MRSHPLRLFPTDTKQGLEFYNKPHDNKKLYTVQIILSDIKKGGRCGQTIHTGVGKSVDLNCFVGVLNMVGSCRAKL